MSKNIPQILFFGSHNKDKVNELKKALPLIAGPKHVLFSCLDISELPVAEENESTLQLNAIAKAKFYSDFMNMPCISDDSGIEIEALDGRPGVHSAYYAGKHGDWEANNKKVLAELKGIKNRNAIMRTVMVYYTTTEKTISHVIAEGTLKGTITNRARGKNGFAYDTIFVPDGHTKTLAEMDMLTKNSLSHRIMAFRNLLELMTK